MAIIAKFRIGDIQFEVGADTERDLFQRITLFGELPRACRSCESTKIWPRHRSNKGYHFYEVVCGDCGARCKIGQNKETDTMFCRGEWEPPYDGGDDRHEADDRDDRPRRDTGRVPTTPPAERPRQETQHRPTHGAGKPYGVR